MNKEQKEALIGSIKKWEKIVAGEGVDEGADNCPCCKLNEVDFCRGCPIFEDTGEEQCRKTPYFKFTHFEQKWVLLHRGLMPGAHQDEEKYDLMLEAKLAAQMELDYLRGLLKCSN